MYSIQNLQLTTENKHFKSLRTYFSNVLADLSTVDEFIDYCNKYHLSRQFLKNLNINFIVFVSHKAGQYSCGHSQIYSERDKAYDYANAMAKNIISEANRIATNSVKVNNMPNVISISYEKMLMTQSTFIQIIEL